MFILRATRANARFFLHLPLAIWIVLTGGVAQADDWPQWRGPNRDGVSAETGWVADWPESGPNILWKAEVGRGCSSMAVANGRLYTMGNVKVQDADTDVIWCLNAETGVVIWKYSYPQPLEPSGYEGGPCVTPCVDGNFVYTLSKRGRAWCFDARTGKLIWDTNPSGVVSSGDNRGFNGGMTSSPFVYGDLLITGAQALKKDSGAMVWDLKSEEACQWASPVPYSPNCQASVLCFNTRGLTSVNLANGSREWSYPLSSDSCSAGADPVLYGDKIILSTRPLRRGDPATMLLQVSEAGPKVMWSRADVVSNFQERVVWKDHVFGCDAHRHTKGDATLKCVNLKTGEVTWSEPNYDWGQLIACDGKLLVIRHGELSIIDANPQKFRLLARAGVVRNVERWAGAANAVGTTAVAPVLANRRIYCRGATGDLVCIDATPQR